MKNTVIFLANGFEEIEAITVIDVLRRADLKCDICSLEDIKVIGAHGITVEADFRLLEGDFQQYHCLVLPGGMPGSIHLKENSKIIQLVKEFNENRKLIAAICAAPIVLKEANIIKYKKLTSFPGVKEELTGCNYREDIVVQQDNIITSRGPATALDFALKIVENLSSKEVSDNLREAMLVNFFQMKMRNS